LQASSFGNGVGATRTRVCSRRPGMLDKESGVGLREGDVSGPFEAEFEIR
jgi:hypothetical protein